MATIPWEPDGGGDPVFIFHNESKGKNKMHVRQLNVNDRKRGWVMIDNTYMEQMELRKKCAFFVPKVRGSASLTISVRFLFQAD